MDHPQRQEDDCRLPYMRFEIQEVLRAEETLQRHTRPGNTSS